MIMNDDLSMDRIRAAVTFDQDAIETWPVVRTWETEEGEVAVMDGHDSVTLLTGTTWQSKPGYITTLLTQSYGTPTRVVGPAALRYLAHRFAE